MPTAYSRITLVNGTRRVDLALPSALPLADVMPQLLRFSVTDERVDSPAAWNLGRLGGPNLNPMTSLGEAGVVDGEVLELRATAEVIPPAYIEDVRDAVEDAVDESGRQWRPETTVSFALLVAASGLTAAILLPEARRVHDGWALATAVLATTLAVLGGWWAGHRGHRLAAPVVLAVGTLWGGVAGWLAAAYVDWPVSGALGAALAGGLVVAALARVCSAQATAHLAAFAVLAAAGAVVAAPGLAGSDPMVGFRLDAVLAVVAAGVLPRLSLTVGGLAAADYKVRNFGLIRRIDLADRFRRSSAILHGSLLAIAVVGAASGYLLAAGPPWDRFLGLTVGLGLALRSRVFSRIPHIVPLRVAGLFVLVALGLRYVYELPALRPWTVLLAVAAAAVGIVLSAVPLSEVTRARVKQLLNVVEMIVVVAMVGLAVGALGVYDWIASVSG